MPVKIPDFLIRVPMPETDSGLDGGTLKAIIDVLNRRYHQVRVSISNTKERQIVITCFYVGGTDENSSEVDK